MRHRILIVDDDTSLVLVLSDLLRSEGFSPFSTADAREAIARLSSEPFDLVLLDVLLPRHSGFDVCRQVRARGVRMPILMMSGRANVEDRILGLRLGADDYLTKPFDPPELLARIDALLRRWHDPRWAAGSISVDFLTGNVRRDGATLSLSSKELQLLRYLIGQRGAVISREELLSAVWGYCGAITRTVDVHIAALRNKLEETPHEPRYIRTVRGQGYLFQD